MNEPTLGQLTQRLDRLERESRIWKRFGATVLVVTTGLALMGQGRSPRAVDAEQFLLRGQNGRPRATLQTAADGTPLLALFDENGTTRLGLGFVAGSPSLTFADKDGRSRIVLGTSEDGALTFAFRGPGERLLRAGTPDILLMNRAGKVIWKAP